MPVGSQNAESHKYASAPGEKEGGDADTLLGETLVYANKVEQHQQQTQCEGTLVYTLTPRVIQRGHLCTIPSSSSARSIRR